MSDFIQKYEVTGHLNSDNSMIILENPKVMKRYLRKLQDKRLILEIKELKKVRSDAQNRWLWGVCYIKIASWFYDTQGEKLTPDEIHAFVVTKVLGFTYEVKELFGEEVLIMRGTRTSKMSTKEFQDAKEKIQKYFAERGLHIPDPREHSLITDYIDNNG